jgi:hypothetical protein
LGLIAGLLKRDAIPREVSPSSGMMVGTDQGENQEAFEEENRSGFKLYVRSKKTLGSGYEGEKGFLSFIQPSMNPDRG